MAKRQPPVDGAKIASRMRPISNMIWSTAMRVIVLGGTWFVGRAILNALVAAGHTPLVVHRGLQEPVDVPDVEHLHCDRNSWADRRADFAAFGADAAIDVSANNANGARAALLALPTDIRFIALSSGDVYRAYESLVQGRQTDAVPLTESSPLRTARHLDGPDCENLEIEEAYRAAGATILRLGAVYGPYDYQYRFEPVLRRIRAGRTFIPIGTGTFLFSRVYVDDVAQAVLAALATERGRGECFNIVEEQTAPMRLFYEQVVAAAGARLDFVSVDDRVLPADLGAVGAAEQHMLISAQKARDVLGWRGSDPETSLRNSVHWHMAHAPAEWSHDFTADDAARLTARAG